MPSCFHLLSTDAGSRCGILITVWMRSLCSSSNAAVFSSGAYDETLRMNHLLAYIEKWGFLLSFQNKVKVKWITSHQKTGIIK